MTELVFLEYRIPLVSSTYGSILFNILSDLFSFHFCW